MSPLGSPSTRVDIGSSDVKRTWSQGRRDVDPGDRFRSASDDEGVLDRSGRRGTGQGTGRGREWDSERLV